MKPIAIVILNWNGKTLLETFLPTLLKFSPEAKVYVADNASTDESVAYLKSQFPEVQIIQNDANYGFAEGYNRALQHVQEPLYALVNSDIEVTHNWLPSILTRFEAEPETVIIQPKILDYKNKSKFEYAGAAGGFIDALGYPFCRGRIFTTLEEDLGQYNDSIPIFWASGACFFVRKSVFEQLQGFDADFFAHQEEIDLCWRAFNLNYIVKYEPQSTVFHIGGATLNESSPYKTYLNFRNSLFMIVKNVPQFWLLPIIFTRLVLDGLAGIQFLTRGKFKSCWAIIHAHFSFYKRAHYFYKKRNLKITTKKYYHTKSIVYSYFIKSGTVFEKIV